jgi:outer membrane receptor for ferrienterochelin and colicins
MTGNLGADYRFRGTPFSVGGNINWTPGYETRLTDTQLSKTGTKRVIEGYGLWTINSQLKLRVTLANAVPHDLITSSIQTIGNESQSVTTNGKTARTVSLRLEVRL